MSFVAWTVTLTCYCKGPESDVYSRKLIFTELNVTDESHCISRYIVVNLVVSIQMMHGSECDIEI